VTQTAGTLSGSQRLKRAGAIYLLAKRAVRLSDSERARLFDSKGATKLL
jgi:hypothetical protein